MASLETNGISFLCVVALTTLIHHCNWFFGQSQHDLVSIHPSDKVALKYPKLLSIAQQSVIDVPYFPSPYCMIDFYGQLQTSIQYFVRNLSRTVKLLLFGRMSVGFFRQVVVMSDGGNVALDWALLLNTTTESLPLNQSNLPIVVMFHGLCGDAESEYIVHLCEFLLKNGYRPVVMVARGCGGLELTSDHIFVGDRAGDIHAVIAAIRMQYPVAKLFWMGFSLGAAQTLKYLGTCDRFNNEESKVEDITAAICVSPPWNFTVNRTPVFWWWSMLLVVPLKIFALKHQSSLYKYVKSNGVVNRISLWRILLASNMKEFDSLMYPIYDSNYKSVEEYHIDSSPLRVAHRISIPTLAISSIDDPICAHDDCPSSDNMGEGLVVVKTKYGGHLAFPQGIMQCLTESWVDHVALSFFNRFLENEK
eukprot:gene8725-11787_t